MGLSRAQRQLGAAGDGAPSLEKSTVPLGVPVPACSG